MSLLDRILHPKRRGTGLEPESDGCVDGEHAPGVNTGCDLRSAHLEESVDTAVTGRPADNDPAARFQLAPLDSELVDELTIWGTFGGAQIRVESRFLAGTDGQPVIADDGTPAVAPPIGCVYIAFRDDAYRSDEDGQPYRLDLLDARRLRDLLNIATARGVL